MKHVLDLNSGRIDQTYEKGGGGVTKHISAATKSCGLEFFGASTKVLPGEWTVKKTTKGRGTHGTGDFAVFVSK